MLLVFRPRATRQVGGHDHLDVLYDFRTKTKTIPLKLEICVSTIFEH